LIQVALRVHCCASRRHTVHKYLTLAQFQMLPRFVW